MNSNEKQAMLETSTKPKYEKPQVKVMDEAELLNVFQVTAAGGTIMWWSS